MMDPSGRDEEEDQDLVQLIGSYNPLPENYYYNNNNRHVQVHHQHHLADQHRSTTTSLLSDSSSQHTAPSMYSQVTGLPHNIPEPRQPLKSRFSMSTFATEVARNNSRSGKKAFWKWSFFFPLLSFGYCFLIFFYSLLELSSILFFSCHFKNAQTFFFSFPSHLPNKHFYRCILYIIVYLHDPFYDMTKHLNTFSYLFIFIIILYRMDIFSTFCFFFLLL